MRGSAAVEAGRPLLDEGRRGALDSNPLGTHAGGFNRGTMGISTMGDYDVVAPSEEVVDAMARATAGALQSAADQVCFTALSAPAWIVKSSDDQTAS